MVKSQTIIKHRLIMLFVLAIASFVFTGCDKGSLGIKTGAIQGYIIDNDTNQPISEVFIKATGGLDDNENKSTYSSGDGSFVFTDANKGAWKINVEKYGYVRAEEGDITCNLANGETITLSPIKLSKVASGTKGILKGYPIDSVTGRALTNFTVTQETPYNERKSKTFDTAATFRDSGWTGLEGGDHTYSISANNYKTFKTTDIEGLDEGVISIGKSAYNLGTIKVEPLTVAVSGTLRNVPGYVLDDSDLGFLTVWAEAAGKVVATYTDFGDGGEDGNSPMKLGNINYMLYVPVTAGSVSVKCKLRGYDIITISSGVSISTANPGGIISGVDVDFSTIEPIKTDLRVIVTGTKHETDNPSTFITGETARVYVKAGGNDVVPYADVQSVNFGGEVTISGVITGYNIKVVIVNQTRKFCSLEIDEFKIPENTDTYPIIGILQEN